MMTNPQQKAPVASWIKWRQITTICCCCCWPQRATSL